MNQITRPYFRHFVIESGSTPENLNSLEWLMNKTEELLSKLDIVVIKNIHHKFKPMGISLVYILSSSHIAIHTWPENEYLHMDLVTCTKNSLIDIIEKVSKPIFGENTKINELKY
jgi:S-adenosylmethionine/arginine decarboxylase-like enzyme